MVASTPTGDVGGHHFDNLGPSRYTLTAAGDAPEGLEVVVDEDALSTQRIELDGSALSRDAGHAVPGQPAMTA